MKEKLIIIGTGSQAPEVVDFVQRYNLFDIVGFSVDKKYVTDTYLGHPVYPTEHLEDYVDKSSVKLFIAISWYNKFNRIKKEKFENLKERGFSFANLISPHALVYPTDLGGGNWIHDFAHIEYGCSLGDNNTILTHAVVAHNTRMGSHNTMVGRSVIAGDSIVGDQCFFGIGSVVYNKLNIGNGCFIGGGAVVKHDLQDYAIVVPADSNYFQGSQKVNELMMSPNGSKLLKMLYNSKE